MRSWRERLSEMLARSPVFSSLTVAERRQLARVARKVELEDGEILWAWGAPGDGVAVVIEGALDVKRTSEDDKTVVFRRMEPADELGFSTLAGEVHSADIAAGGDALVAVLPRRDLQDLLAEQPQLALRIIGHLGHLVGLLSDEKVAWRAGHVEERVLAWLRANAADGDTIRITHEQLAHHVGATRANVTRALGRLAKAGVLDQGRGRLTVRTFESTDGI